MGIHEGTVWQARFATRADVVKEVRVTVMHGVAHHFGLSDDALDQAKYG